MSNQLKFHTERLFRQTDSVHFSDIGVPNSNGIDLVQHYGPATSPPNHPGTGEKSFYVHSHQTDVNRVIYGARVFELVAPDHQLEFEHYLVLLTPDVGGVEIPPGVYHRSVSCSEGSILLNHAIRTSAYDETQEFFPVLAHEDPKVCEILNKLSPHYVNGSKKRIEEFIQTRKFVNPYL
jgi:hypothetical protein